jgi:hypothetical protein
MKNTEGIGTNEKLEGLLAHNTKIVLPENIKQEIKKNVDQLNNILKDDMEFAKDLIIHLHSIKEGQDYLSTLPYFIKQKHPFNYELSKTMNELGDLITGGHELVVKEFFMSTKPLCDAIETEIVQSFIDNLSLLGEVTYNG